MSQTSEQDARSTDSSSPPGRPFDSESAQKAAHEAWQSQREKVLREHGLWETWKCVPPEDQRSRPLEDYLPGGPEYE